jgi:hypothetical protein
MRRLRNTTGRCGRDALLVTPILAVSGLSALAQTPPLRGYEFHPIGLSGPGYEAFYGNSTLFRRDQFVRQLSSTGQVIGGSTRYGPTGSQFGFDAWLYDDLSTRVIGLTGDGYERAQNNAEHTGIDRSSFAEHINDRGEVAGWSTRYNAVGAGLGSDAWVYDSRDDSYRILTLTGPGYETASTGAGGGIVRSSGAKGINAGSQVMGVSTRYGATSDQWLGTDAWFHDGTSTHVIGLTGGIHSSDTGYGLNHLNMPQQLNDAGQVIGYHERKNGAPYGQDTWFYDGSSTREIGLTGNGYEYNFTNGVPYRYNAALRLTQSGRVLGYTKRRDQNGNDRGQDAWLFDGSSTQLVGLTGSGYQAGAYRFSEATQVNESGMVAGISHRRGPTGYALGQDAWLFDGHDTHVIGLVGPGYDAVTLAGTVRNSRVVAMNEAGFVTGNTLQNYVVSGTETSSTGGDSWLYDGVSTRRINPIGGVYEQPYTSQQPGRGSNALAINAIGQVIGTARRFTGEHAGWSAWFYDVTTDTTSELHFSFPPRSGLESHTYPMLLTEQGVVLGNYRFFESGGPSYDRAFWWSAEEGFRDLGELVFDLSAEQWGTLSNVYDALIPGAAGAVLGGSPQFIVGRGIAQDQAGGESVYLLTAKELTPGDADLDGDVDLSDLGILATYYDQHDSHLGWVNGDFDGDDDVDLSDLGALASNYEHGQALALSDFAALTAVPEPAGAAVVLAGVAGLWGRGRRPSAGGVPARRLRGEE